MHQLPFSDSAEFIFAKLGNVDHDVAVVLGSGLGGFTKHLTKKMVLETASIPGYPISTVAGHKGEIISATIERKKVLVFSGRVHYYESMSTLAASVTSIVSFHLGIKKIILTNAAGILNGLFSPGDLMVITDQINLTSRNVLIDIGAPMTAIDPIYSASLAGAAARSAEKCGVDLKRGVYVGLTGPTYETASEVKFYRQIGGDAIGMSTIHEATFARYAGMEVLGISCLTNYSTGITSEKLSHEEVTEIGKKVDLKFSRLLTTLVKSL